MERPSANTRIYSLFLSLTPGQTNWALWSYSPAISLERWTVYTSRYSAFSSFYGASRASRALGPKGLDLGFFDAGQMQDLDNGPSDLAAVTSATMISGTWTTETLFTCVDRICTSTSYACPTSHGGGCCPYDSNCVSDNQCLGPFSSRQIPACPSSQSRCGESFITPSIPPSSTGGSGNSLKIGLGVGIPVVLLAAGALVFAWHIRRAKRQQKEASAGEDRPVYMKPEVT